MWRQHDEASVKFCRKCQQQRATDFIVYTLLIIPHKGVFIKLPQTPTLQCVTYE